MKTTLRFALCGLALALSSNAQARNFDWRIQGNIDFGGDELVEVFYVGGDKDTIKAGELMQMSVGTVFSLTADSSLEGQFTIGWKFDNTNADNGDIIFDRYPLEFLLFCKNEMWCYGGGLTYHLNPKLEGEGFFSGLDVEFDDALGFVVQIERQFFSSQFYVGGRITMIDYDIANESLDGDSIGLIFTARF